MAWLFFIDESGHDHKSMPYEVRGGFAIHVSRLWSFVQDMQEREERCFGFHLHEYKMEIKGSKLLNRKRFRFARQSGRFNASIRQRLCRSFLEKTHATGRRSNGPTRDEYTAYGQACLCMAQEVFDLLEQHEAVVLASAIPKAVAKPRNFRFEDYLRKDLVFLLERFYYLLSEKNEHGVLVMDATEKVEDRRFVARMERYFTKTDSGHERSQLIVPTPFFVSSDMAYAVQAADVCIYCVNWGFRLPRRGMDAGHRPEIRGMCGEKLLALQFRGQRQQDRDFLPYGIVYVPDPYTGRQSA